MENETFTITLSDGTQLKDIKMSGSEYVSSKKITESTFEGKLNGVTIESSEGMKEEHSNMELVTILKYEDGYYFALRDLSQDELKRMKIESDIEYIAMMSDIDMEEE